MINKIFIYFINLVAYRLKKIFFILFHYLYFLKFKISCEKSKLMIIVLVFCLWF